MHFMIKLNYESLLFFPDYTKLLAVPFLFLLLRYYSDSHYHTLNSWSLCFNAHSVFMALMYHGKKETNKPAKNDIGHWSFYVEWKWDSYS